MRARCTSVLLRKGDPFELKHIDVLEVQNSVHGTTLKLQGRHQAFSQELGGRERGIVW